MIACWVRVGPLASISFSEPLWFNRMYIILNLEIPSIIKAS